MHIVTPGTRRRFCGGAVALATVASLVAVAQGAPVAVGGGCDYYSDSNDQVTRSALVQASAGLGIGSVFAAGLRFDNNVAGAGYGWTGGFGLPVAPFTQLRASGSRFVGDGNYRAWRIKAGAMLALPIGPTAGLYYTHEDNSAAPRTNGVLAEGDLRLLHGLGLRATAGYARNSDGVGSALGTVGASGPVLHRVEWSAEVGLTQNRLIEPGQSIPGPHRATDGLPIIGGGGGKSAGGTTASSSTTGSVASVLLGARITFP